MALPGKHPRKLVGGNLYMRLHAKYVMYFLMPNGYTRNEHGSLFLVLSCVGAALKTAEEYE